MEGLVLFQGADATWGRGGNRQGKGAAAAAPALRSDTAVERCAWKAGYCQLNLLLKEEVQGGSSSTEELG